MPLVTSDQAIESALRSDGIIPDIIDSIHQTTLLDVSFGDGKDVTLGNTLAVSETQHTPRVTFMSENPSDKYTLIMTDPDAPSRNEPRMREYRHWIVTNLSGSSPTEFAPSNLSQGTELTSYMGPAPPRGTGPHRYVFLLYKQSHGTNVDTLQQSLSSDRPGFRAKQFSSHGQLELVGANYFFAENK
ncbi:hypothetical protein BGW38_003946 [Lunasporangiospora selenospora]|uniref:Phosphatidylethanolamine-binding protein n=1 Tax=Lunasporangiospora selenospora TaxID=979761 RepID=A0A9P6FPX6_9FUNG|nr:hypothetical protein BGW38_003946 [Lunasporangiospora selenospora]